MHTLPILPFETTDLEPHISANTLSFHYGKHHQAYVDNLNKLIADTPMEKDSLQSIILKTAGREGKEGIFNNAAQAYNHEFFWNCLKPVSRETLIPVELKNAVIHSFGSWEKMIEELKAAAMSQFGSGWVWLVKEDSNVKIVKTSNADTPIVHGQQPLFTIDIWEHSYYLDYQNRRADYVNSLIENLANWDFSLDNLRD
jgi:superoxide dismutase, Fe-Mn family